MHQLAEEIAAARRRCHRRTDVFLFVIAVAMGLALLVTAAQQAPLGWMPL